MLIMVVETPVHQAVHWSDKLKAIIYNASNAFRGQAKS